MPTDPQAREKWHVPPAKSVNMPTQTTETPTDFTKKCHYTLQVYTCTHKTWLNKPRIRHNCMLSQLPEQSYSKRRCTNMATKPKEIQMREVCAKCRPVSLGVVKEVREYERVIGEEEERAAFGVGVDLSRKTDKALEVESGEDKNKGEDENNKLICESKKGVNIEIGQDAEGNAMMKPGEVKEEGQMWQTVREWPARETQESRDIVDQVPAATPPTTPQTPMARSIFGSFANLFTICGKQDQQQLEEDGDEPFEIWTKVDEDPDWEKIDAKDAKQGMLWKESGDWVHVNEQ